MTVCPEAFSAPGSHKRPAQVNPITNIFPHAFLIACDSSFLTIRSILFAAPPHSFRVDDFLHINIIIKVRAVGCIVAGTALVFFSILKLFPRVGMSFCRPVAGFTLDILKFGARFSGGSETRGVAGQAGRI
jgi:hypothetical protein